MCLGTTVRKWSFGLPMNSVNACKELKCQLINNFNMTCDQKKT
jgi:hypothetical protein